MSRVIISFFRVKGISVPLTLSIALHLLNISINFINPSASSVSKSSINEIESFAEFLVEEMGECSDFFKEYDDNESESSFQKSAVSLVYVLSSSLSIPYSAFFQKQPASGLYILFRYSAFLNISTPPPKIV